MAEEKSGNFAYLAIVSIVAIVAVVALLVLISGNKQTDAIQLGMEGQDLSGYASVQGLSRSHCADLGGTYDPHTGWCLGLKEKIVNE
ncbi:hypothetical protein JW968_01385 [Candidatus Woesearchaeota archaeon]|nr:hypothetical protein [Candidatus Woesearchaeota archaeon]